MRTGRVHQDPDDGSGTGLIRAAVAIGYGGPQRSERGDAVPTCRSCHLAEYRDRWGCDAPRDEPVWQIACECGGAERFCQRDDCDEGWRPVHRCPHALTREAPRWLADFLYSWRNWNEQGVLPGPGAFDDQPGAWCSGVHIADSERAAWDRLADEERRMDAERNKARR